jgi:hypothetical protein
VSSCDSQGAPSFFRCLVPFSAAFPKTAQPPPRGARPGGNLAHPQKYLTGRSCELTLNPSGLFGPISSPVAGTVFDCYLIRCSGRDNDSNPQPNRSDAALPLRARRQQGNRKLQKNSLEVCDESPNPSRTSPPNATPDGAIVSGSFDSAASADVAALAGFTPGIFTPSLASVFISPGLGIRKPPSRATIFRVSSAPQ